MIILVYKKIPLALAAVVAAVVLCLFSGLDYLAVMKGEFMVGATNFVKLYFLLFLLSAIYGSAMETSGAAYSLGKWLAKLLGAKWAIWGVSFAAFVLTYGGISCFVIVFAMYPIALVLFKEANLSRKLIPAAIAAGAFLAPNTLIGSPAVVNIIPVEPLGTSPTAAPMASIIVSLFMFLAANAYLIMRNKSNQKRGIGFVLTEKARKLLDENENRETINPFLAAIPLIVIIVTLNILKLDVLISVACGIFSAYVLFWKRINSKIETLIAGTQSGINSVMSVAPVVGLGTAVTLTVAFGLVVDFALSLEGSPLISWAAASMIIAAITSSGSGAQAIILSTLGDTYLALGINPEILHRILTCAILGIGNTPWNGTICVTMAACDCSHRDSYLDVFLTTLLPSVLGTILLIGLGIMFY